MYRNGIFTEKYTQTATLNEGEQRRETLISKKKPIQPRIYQNIRTEIFIKSELTLLHETNTERGTRSTYLANTRSTHKTIRPQDSISVPTETLRYPYTYSQLKSHSLTNQHSY